MVPTTESLTKTLGLSIRVENYNEGSIIDNGILLLNTSIFRMGEIETTSTWKYFAGAQTEICKLGGGKLHSLIIQDGSGNAYVYDGIDDTGRQIADVDLATGTLVFNLEFNDGLYIETTTGANVTVTYE